MPALQKNPMLAPAQHQRLNRLRRTAFAVAGGAYILAFFHRFAPAAIAGDLQHGAYQKNLTACNRSITFNPCF